MYHTDARHPNASLEEKLRYIFTLRGDGAAIDLTIRQPYLDLLAALGNPHTNLPPILHVAGTNGKGSTIAIMRAILEAAGQRVHTYTSPHLLTFNERIVLGGMPIDDAELHERLDHVLEHAKGKNLTFFEITTALAFEAFAAHEADFLLLETGMGGRLDCTNVITKPLASIITHIGFDHTEFLGETIPEIASEKAGIIKRETPCIISRQTHTDTYSVFEKAAADKSAPLYRAGEKWSCAANDDHLIFEWRGEPLSLPLPALGGIHQIDNAGAAIAACLIALPDLSDAHIASGLQNAEWPARLEQITTGGLFDTLPQGTEIWYDGGHNEDAARALAQQAQKWQNTGDKPLILVLGMMQNKDAPAYVRHLAPYLSHIYTITLPDAQAYAYTPETLKAAISDEHSSITALRDIHALAAHTLPANSRILVAGSLYLAPALK